jgi:hypothetical protein
LVGFATVLLIDRLASYALGEAVLDLFLGGCLSVSLLLADIEAFIAIA